MTHRRLKFLAAGLLLLGLTPSASAAPQPQPHYKLIHTEPLAGSQGWDYMTLDAVNRRLYVTRQDHVDVFDADSGQIVGQIAQTNGVHGVALAPDLGRGWTSDGQDNAVTPFDLNTLTPLGDKIKVGDSLRPDCIVYDAATKRVFTFNGGSDDATAIDAVTGQVLGTIPLGGKPEFAVADGRGMLYDNLEDTSEIVAIDARTLMVTHRWPLAPVVGPSGLAIDRDARRLFSVGDNGLMAVMNADTGQIVATPGIGNGPDAVVFDSVYRMALSSNGRDGTLTVVQEQDPQTCTVADTVTTQVGARTIALDARTHNVWLIAARYAPVPPNAPADTRPVILGGSVVLLEFSPAP